MFIFSIATLYGSMPVAFVVVSDETEETLKLAFSWVKEFGIDVKYAMTDDCASLRKALIYTWPNVHLLLCTWHFSQAYWTWFLDKRHDFSENDRKLAMSEISKLIYTIDLAKISDLQASICEKYGDNKKFMTKFERDLERIDQWNHGHRSNL